MLRITPSGSSERAKDYFRLALSRGEYYTEEKTLDQEIVGHWGGKGAERLGLSGEVDRASFDALCDNLHPVDGSRLTPRTRCDRRAGYDLNFHVPKSVSLLLELTGDQRIKTAFEDAVRETMRDLERDARTRVRIGGADDTRATSELIWAEFVHFTARPVQGVPDPHLHLHVFVPNQTWDPVEKRWKAIDLGDVVRDAPYHQAAFHARMAERMIGLGHGVQRTGESWEIAGVDRDLIGAFSRRTEEIEAIAKERGIEDAAAKAALGARTRASKIEVASMEELRTEWRERLSDAQRASLDALRTRATRSRQRSIICNERTLDACLEHAAGRLFEKSSVVPERRLRAEALKHGVGVVTVDTITQRLATHIGDKAYLIGDLNRQRMVTTPAVLREEQRMLATVREGRGRFVPLKDEHTIRDPQLSDEQRAAVRHVLQSTDSVVLVRGRVGVGKTRMMSEVVNALEQSGHTVSIAAPTAMATHEVLRKDGFATAQTVARVLKDRELHKTMKDGVLWVDEAGLLSVPDLQRLVRLADRTKCRLLFTGDTRQHRSVIRGDALKLLETESGLTAATLSTVRRQREPLYRQAAEALAKGDLATGVARLEAMDAIKEVQRDDVATTVANEYMKSVTSGRSTLIVSPTHAEGRAVTEAVRASLRRGGLIGGIDHSVEQLRSRHLSEAEKRDPLRHRVGDVIVFHQNVPGYSKGERAVVARSDADGVAVSKIGETRNRTLPLNRAQHFEVFERHSLDVAVGDVIRITRNGRTVDQRHQLNNGSLYKVSSIGEDGSVIFTNGWRTTPGFGHVAHGYCVTSDASQGRTVDHVILAQSSWSNFAGSMQQWYTSLTRGRHRATIVTDDRERLLRTVERDASRLSATEFMREATTPPKERGLQHRGAIGRWLGRLHEHRKRRERRVNERNRSRERGRGGRDGRDGRDRSIEREERDRDR